MPREDGSLAEAITVKFVGRDADVHGVDALMLAQSLSGIARVYNSVAHFYFVKDYQRSNHSDVRVQVGPPTPGTVSYLVWFFLVHGTLPMYPEALFEMADFAIPKFVKAIIARKSGQNALVETLVEQLASQGDRIYQLAKARADNDAQVTSRLLGIVEHLAGMNNRPLADLASPVGKSVNELRQIPKFDDPIVVDAPIAEALRSPTPVAVGDTVEIKGIFTAVDTETGSFKFEDAESGKTYRGKITDPAIMVPSNIYTHALDKKRHGRNRCQTHP